MIRLSDKKDINSIIQLWSECFGDTEADVRFFLDNCYIETNTLIYEVNGEIASMLFLLEGDMSVEGIDYPSYYLYAACTSEKYRGKGLMAELLSFAKTVAAERKKSFICLRPAEESLFDFYEKHGYKTVFYIKRAEYIIKDLSDIVSDKPVFTSVNRDEIRNSAFSSLSFFKWRKESVDFAFLHNDFFGGKSSETCKGYSLYTTSDVGLCVKETTFADVFSVAKMIERTLLNSSDRLIINYPPFGNVDGITTPFGMILAIDNNAEKIIKNLSNAYLGLTLE